MFDRKSWILDRLKDMPLYEVDRLTGMQMRGTPGWEKVAAPVLSALVDAYTHDNVDPDDLPGTVADASEGLVPAGHSDVVWELTVIASAWELGPDDDYQPADTGTVIDSVRSALEEAYKRGLIAFAEAIEGEATAEEAEVEAEEDEVAEQEADDEIHVD